MVVPCKDYFSGRDVGWYCEIEGLSRCGLASLAVRTVAFEGSGDLECFALVNTEADLAGSAVVVANAS